MATHWQQNYVIYRKYLQSIVTMYEDRQDVRMFTEILLTLGASIIFGLFAIKPTLVTIAQLFSEVETKKETAEKLDQKIDHLSQAELIYEQEKPRINLLNSAIPERPTPETVIRQIEGIAQRNSVSITSLTLENVYIIGRKPENAQTTTDGSETLIQEPQTPSFKISVEVSGNYQSLSSFLSDLESTRRPILPTETIFRINTDNTSQASLMISINGLVPYYNQ